MPQDDGTVLMEGVSLIFRNFTGKKRQYNPEGKRNFAVLLDPEVAVTLEADDWKVKYRPPRDEDEEPQAFLPVQIKFDSFRPPRIVLITSRGRTNLDQGSVEMLDWADILNVDLIVRPHHWEMDDGRKGTTAYLQTLYVTIEEDPLDAKYAELDEQ